MAYRATEKTRAAQAQRRAALLDEATALVAKGGFAAATVKAIAERCEVSVGSVYSYFDGSGELLAAVFRVGADQELAAVRDAVDAAAGPVDRLRALVETFALRAIKGRQLAWSLLFEPVDPRIDAERLDYRAAYHALTTEILREGMSTGVFPQQHLEVTAAALIGAISESLTGRLSPAHAVATTDSDDARTVEAILRFCLHGVGYEPTVPGRPTTEATPIEGTRS
ncbi:TetR/AcrR family transcriptional regulator [Rhodococcus spelaei]|uniref:TetR/AcrR family transcriptional regulator n=1 Tax=Rhodococcus spelaei TaxID=2546320 RepID=A0A541AZI7_9NOCA|nr:TetR/AcrR family transcriptional regulator [Rhodococcus spelaei]TQF65476.1 TetR/AcrR family transcriptional regulator [Rhodococcus spelaei]